MFEQMLGRTWRLPLSLGGVAHDESPAVGQLSREEVVKVAQLALLELTDDEIDLFTGQLGAVLDRARELQAFDVDGVAPTAHPYPLVNVLRPDEPEQNGETASIREGALAAAPDAEEGCFKVPPALGEQP
jgi:aspartyl-tRNA(Asn)/glutamyl-tRNA(Gln) amidotransferase subunit C